MPGLRVMAYGRAGASGSTAEQIAAVECWTLAHLHARVTTSDEQPPEGIAEWPRRGDVLQAIHTGTVDAIGVVELSRLSATARGIAAITAAMANLGVKLVLASLNQVVDFSSVAGRQTRHGIELAARLEAVFEAERRGRVRGPRRWVDLELVERLLREGESLAAIGARLGVGRATIVRRRAAARR